MTLLVDRVAVIGVGLIGGSFGMALKKRGLVREVVGVGRHPDRLQKAVDLCAVDRWTTDLQAGVRDADLIYVATPVGREIDFVRAVSSFAKPGCVITDAGSTKGEICRGGDSAVTEGVHFVGGHPMAGSEATGVEAGSPDLFVGATYVLTPSDRTDTRALSIVHGLAESIGSRVVVMSPEAHDRCVAVISHLPHLIAAALMETARGHSETDPQVFDLIAGSFRDMTRVAGSSPELWRDICLTNVDAIASAAENFQRALGEGLSEILSGDAQGFEDWFARAKQARDAIANRPLPGS